MGIMRYTAGGEVTPEERARLREMFDAAAKLPEVYDPDCPPLTEEQLAEFYPVNFASWEERARFMEAAKTHRKQ
jgi:hypothetical protein